MLGSTARKLRIFGFDTLYFESGEDAELLRRAREQKRVLLTSDRALFSLARRRGVEAVLVDGKTDGARLLSMRAALGPGFGTRIGGEESRCAVCNGELEAVPKGEAAGRVPEKVLERHRLFFRCSSCARFYWRGGHWDRLRRLSRSVETKGLTPGRPRADNRRRRRA
jgi:uncharacterized protein